MSAACAAASFSDSSSTALLLLDPSLFKVEDAPKQIEKFNCCICNTLCKEAVESPCGHLFCQVCIETWLEKKPECGMCRSPVSKLGNLVHSKRKWDLHPALFIRRQIAALEMRCIHKECQWSGQLGLHQLGLDIHLKQHCLFHPIACKFDASHPLQTRLLQESHELTCERRPVNCDLCALSVLFCDLATHKQHECSKLVVKCPWGCEQSLERGCMDSHCEKDCPKYIIACPFARFGCFFRAPRESMSDHEVQQVKDHCVLLKEFENIIKKEPVVSLNPLYPNAISPGIIRFNDGTFHLQVRFRDFEFYRQYRWWLNLQIGDLLIYKINSIAVIMAQTNLKLWVLSLPFGITTSRTIDYVYIDLLSAADTYDMQSPIPFVSSFPNLYSRLVSFGSRALVVAGETNNNLILPEEIKLLWISEIDSDYSSEEEEAIIREDE